MIIHAVFLRMSQGYDDTELAAVMSGLETLTGKLDGMLSFEHGPNRDFEAKSQDYPYGFLSRFRDTDALMAYVSDPDHKALGARLVALCQGGADGITVYDLEVPA